MATKINYQGLFNRDQSHMMVGQAPDCTYVICIDPSGSEKNGKGSTGIVLGCTTHQKVLHNETVVIGEKPRHEDYVIQDKGALVDYLIEKIDNFSQYTTLKAIIEDYISYGDTMGLDAETKYVVDAIHEYCKKNDIAHDLPIASEHKTRFPKERLVMYGVDTTMFHTRHELDALKMFLYDTMFHQQRTGNPCRKCRKIERRK